MANGVYMPDPEPTKIQAALPPGHTDPLRIRVDFCISTTGKVTDVKAVGDESAPKVGAVLVDTIRKWRFKPFIVNGEPIKACTQRTFTISFG